MERFLNNYRFRKVNGKYFITTDSGSWAVLNEDEFAALRRGHIDELYPYLQEREIVLDDSNIDEYTNDLRKRNMFLFQGTSLHIIVLTLRCNMGCVYCHASSVGINKKEYDMSKESAKKVVDFIFQSSSPAITLEFQGGEPLLNWDIVKYIIKYAKEKNISSKKSLNFALVSNLSLMDDEKMDYLIREGVSVCTSLDGPKALHDKNRHSANGSNYEQVIYWIKRFSQEYKKRCEKNHEINALVTLSKESLKYPDEIVDEYVNLGLRNIHLRFLNRMGVAKLAWGNIKYTAEEYLDFWKKAMERIKHHQSNGREIMERMAEIITQKIGGKVDPNFLDMRSPCGAAIGQLVYQHNGDIYTCDEGRMIGDDTFLIGNVFSDSYPEIILCSKTCAVVNASINDQYICDCCAYKPYCGLCPVCSFGDEGSLITNVAKSERCKIFKGQFDWVVSEKFIN